MYNVYIITEDKIMLDLDNEDVKGQKESIYKYIVI